MTSTSSIDALEKLLDEVKLYSFNVNNLFEFNNLWRCNLRSSNDTSYYAFANGDTLIEALGNALTAAKREKKLYGAKDDLSDIL